MKVIFLDFDGVLNCDRYVRSCGHFGVVIDPARMELLKKIVDATDAEIVLSTSWREHWGPVPDECDETGNEINRIFGGYGISIVGKTPVDGDSREGEILSWLDSHPEVESFAVLDDMFLDGKILRGRFVRTSTIRGGLDEESVKAVTELLNSPYATE